MRSGKRDALRRLPDVIVRCTSPLQQGTNRVSAVDDIVRNDTDRLRIRGTIWSGGAVTIARLSDRGARCYARAKGGLHLNAYEAPPSAHEKHRSIPSARSDTAARSSATDRERTRLPTAPVRPLVTHENALRLVDRRVRIAHGGPRYVRHDDPEGLIVAVTDTLMFMQDPARPSAEPRAWELSLIAEAHCLDAPASADAAERQPSAQDSLERSNPPRRSRR